MKTTSPPSGSGFDGLVSGTSLEVMTEETFPGSHCIITESFPALERKTQ